MCVKMVRLSCLHTQRLFLCLCLHQLLHMVIRNLLQQHQTDCTTSISKNVHGNACMIVGMWALCGWLYEHMSEFAECQCT